MTRSIAIVGEAPSGEPGPALSARGSSGRRLARLCAAPSFEAYEARFHRVNLFDSPRRWWSTASARTNARDLTPRLIYADAVVLLGARVRDAFKMRSFGWFDAKLLNSGERVRRWYVAPHPSGRSRWWNEPANVSRAEAFWKELYWS